LFYERIELGELMSEKQGIKKKLRSGFTTGTCAAVAAKAAASMLLTKEIISQETIKIANGKTLNLPLIDVQLEVDYASCAVKKDSGDDPDITNGILVYATVTKAKHESITVGGGTGVGRVTKPGLACKIGEAAINPVPREMIIAEVQTVCTKHNYSEGLDVVISVPEGEEIARKTFNPRLGIIGGISILGTTGIVEPMSDKAWTDSLYLELRQQYALGNRNLLICPGNYGQKFTKQSLGIDIRKAVKCSNFIGEVLDYAVDLSFDSLLLIGHSGKLVKLGAGIMNTHSKFADARMEVIALHAALQGISSEKVQRLMACNTSEEAALFLNEEGIADQVFQSIMDKIDYYVQKRVQSKIKTGVLLFSNEVGVLGKTQYTDELIRLHQISESV